jgi:phenylpyruvate tautomerase PptA (4-oxalocrotonate tautomerase family)
MPIVKIAEQGQRNGEEKARLVATLFEAIKDTLGVSPNELQARYQTFAAEDFFPPPGSVGYVAI